ncbi:MAG TPA: GntR family transcriptional regulator [Thermodesulfobacteriota bacterium]|nr:GntR family transcriptional regulator [Thermodesulfobacteriota bacterium]
MAFNQKKENIPNTPKKSRETARSKGKSRSVKDGDFEHDHPMKQATKTEDSPVDVAYQKIKEMMYHHELVPGQKLLYQELAKKLNMSITPVIQALNRLQLLKIVYSERNKGYYVGEADPVEAEELFMAREALEVFLVPTILEKMTPKKLEAIEKAMKEHVKAVSFPQYRRLLLIIDTNFHLEMIKCAENKVIYNFCKLIFERIYLKYRPEYMREERLKEAAKEHRMLFEALKSGDVKKTERLIKDHIRSGREHIVNSLWEDRHITL